MISRRLLRVKILQILYAGHSKQDQSINQTEKELFFSINKAYDLYHLLLLIPLELVKTEESKIDNSKLKHRPTQDEINPNLRFVENAVLTQLRKNWQLSKYVGIQKLGWTQYPEIIKPLFNQIRNSEYFQAYLLLDKNDYEADKQLVIRILEEIAACAEVEAALEDMSIFWLDDIELVLNMVIKTIKTFKPTDGAEKQLMSLYKNEDDLDFAKKLFRKIALNHAEFSNLIRIHAQNWEYDRIAVMDILIMQMAIAEILEFPSIPVKVSLNEYIDIAKEYSTANSNMFINGILDNIVKALKADHKIEKMGRGLIE